MPAWLLIWIGPLLLAARPWLALVPGFGTVRAWLVGATYAAVLVGGLWAGARALQWWQGDVMTAAEADARCVSRADGARVKAREAALAAREAALARRVEMVEREAAELAALELEMGGYRETTAGTGGRVLLGADDGWLRGWRGSRPAGPGGGGSGR